MWESLPPLVLEIIYEHLDPTDKMSASITCKNWREALFNPRSTIHEHLHVKFLCKPSKSQLNSIQTDIPRYFIQHAKSLIIDWCACHEDVLIQLLSAVTSINFVTRKIHFMPKGKFFGCIRKSESVGDHLCSVGVFDMIAKFIKQCKKLASINFGSNHYFSRSKTILAAVENRLASGHLKELNISDFYRVDSDMESLNDTGFDVNMQHVPMRFIDNKCMMQNITVLYTNWDSMFETIIKTLSSNSNAIKVLGLLVYNTLAFNEKISTLPITNLWTELKSHKPGLKVRLTLTEIYRGYVKFVLDKEIPLSSVCVINHSEEYAYIVLDFLKTTQKGTVLEELAFHHVEGFHFSGIFPMFGNPTGGNFGSYSLLINDLQWLQFLKRFSWSGLFIRDTDILQLITDHASTLEDLTIHKQDVVCESQATCQYYIPMASPKVYGLEKAVSTKWGRTWKLLKDPPIQRLPRRGIRGYRYDLYEEMFWVLQNKAC